MRLDPVGKEQTVHLAPSKGNQGCLGLGDVGYFPVLSLGRGIGDASSPSKRGTSKKMKEVAVACS